MRVDSETGVEYARSGDLGLFKREFVMGSARGSSDMLGYDTPRHGCSIELAKRHNGSISHLCSTEVSYPTIRSYGDGIKVGCTFVTSEALKQIHEWHQSFLRGETEKTWQ